MKQGTNSRRPRGGRPGGRRPYNSNASQGGRTLESNGPNVKLRGSISQIWDKYQTLARDAIASGNRVSAENYFQHAEHYLRLMNGAGRPNAQSNPQPPAQDSDTEAPAAAPTLAAESAADSEEPSATAKIEKPESPAN